jgi:hypothetical protein
MLVRHGTDVRKVCFLNKVVDLDSLSSHVPVYHRCPVPEQPWNALGAP